MVGQTNLFSLIHDDSEEMNGKRDHESDPTPWQKGNRFQKPDERILNFARTGDGCEENGITKDESQAPAGKTSQTEPLMGNRKPWKV